jgi:hypothetical protein
MAVVIVHSKATFVSGGISFSPLGETGEGFSCGKIPIMPVKNIIPGQTVTKEKLQSAPSALSGTSPKYDKKKSECGF